MILFLPNYLKFCKNVAGSASGDYEFWRCRLFSMVVITQLAVEFVTWFMHAYAYATSAAKHMLPYSPQPLPNCVVSALVHYLYYICNFY